MKYYCKRKAGQEEIKMKARGTLWYGGTKESEKVREKLFYRQQKWSNFAGFKLRARDSQRLLKVAKNLIISQNPLKCDLLLSSTALTAIAAQMVADEPALFEVSVCAHTQSLILASNKWILAHPPPNDDLEDDEYLLNGEMAMLTFRAREVNHQSKLTHPHPKRNFVPIAVATKSGLVLVNTAKQSSPRVAASISTARHVNTAALKQKVDNVTTGGPEVVVSTAEGKRENVVKSLACWIWRPTGKVIDHISKDSGSYMPKRFDYVDPQGRLKHMTGNKSYLTDYQDIDGGFVAFAGSPKGGKITEKLLDESQVLLKVPRQNNMYSFDLKNVVPSGGIKREFSVAKTPQQNGVVEIKNMTLIEAARTMLVDSLLPTTFWAEAVSTACYVQNRVLVTKPHNKTPYELLLGRPPSISFMIPFRCPVTILNTLDPLGKIDGKADEGFLVGYSINSKAFRVFNTRTRKVEENLHINFLENKPNVAGSGPEWIFDIDSLTNSMNYEPVTARNQTNKNAVSDDAGKKTNEEPANEGKRNGQENEGGASNNENDQNVQDFRAELDNLLVQQKEGYANSTNRDSIVSPSISTVGQKFSNANDLPTDPLIPDLEDIGIFIGAYDDEDVGAEVDLNNLETTMNVSPIPTTKIHKDHPKDQIIGDINPATQTRRMTKISEEHAMTLVDLPKGKRAIRTKWVYRNKKDERGIVVRNKARLVAQGYTQEEGIDYDEVFAHVARIEAIKLFLAYASFMGLIMYQMDVKSAFLYGTIEEEVYVCQPHGFEDPQFPNKVYKVEKALYGLHQAPRAWYETLSTYLLENGYRRGTIDKTLFIKKDRGDILLVQVYVDDIIFGSIKKSLCVEFEQMMHKRFQMSSIGELTFFLGLQGLELEMGVVAQCELQFEVHEKFGCEVEGVGWGSGGVAEPSPSGAWLCTNSINGNKQY
ncbi:putative ribonuclease H-like domain-containing protein [Tanacetum coccineum]